MPLSDFPADAAFLPATCLHAALFPTFSGLELPECPPYAAMPKADTVACPLVNLPFSPQEARACLAELRSLNADALSQELHRTVEHLGRANLPVHEAAALARFSGTAATDVSPEARLRQAQTLLLMAWVQEERVLEIAELSRRCARSEKKLAALLGDGDTGGHDSAPDCPAAPDAELLALLPAWPFVLEQLSLFLPAGTVFCVTHPDLVARLRDSGRLAPGPHGLCGRFGLRELSRRPGSADGEYLFILPNKVQA